MKRLNCFATGFSLAPSRVIYQHGGETPSQAPTPPEGGKKEKPALTPEQMQARQQREAKERADRKFQERVAKVQELQTKLGELNAKQEKAMKSGQEKKDTMDAMEYQMIHEQMVDLAKQFNQELGLNIDFQNLQFLDVEVRGKGLSMSVLTYTSQGVNERSLAVGLRPDGSHETREDVYPDKTVTYFDSRTNERVTYGPLPARGGHIPEVVNPDGSRTQSLEVENNPAQQKFQKERAGRFWPSTE